MARAARIFACQCGVTVLETAEGVRYVWTTGRVHSCEQDRLAWIDTLAEEALDGGDARLLSEAIDQWVRR